VTEFATMNEQQKEQTSLMMQALLADRFKLKAHFESRELPIYLLALAGGGQEWGRPKNSQQSWKRAIGSAQTPSSPPSAEGLCKGVFDLGPGSSSFRSSEMASGMCFCISFAAPVPTGVGGCRRGGVFRNRPPPCGPLGLAPFLR
jgi:uncharacterized protein (TIGR03435 family)